MSEEYLHSTALMGTVVTIHVVGAGERDERERVVERAIGWFREVEARCTRFDPASELRRLCSQTGTPVAVSPMLLEVVQFALAVAEETGGAFDPTVGVAMERRGFDREYRSGRPMRTDIAADAGVAVSYRDVRVDAINKTITLHRALVLDLGAVAKGLAIDLAARELQPFANFVIDAGGDLYFGGHKSAGVPWTVGIRHPRAEREVTETLCVSDTAVCTSGDYERVIASEEGGMHHHIVDPRSGRTATAAASATVVARSAMVADALATAAFVLGPAAGVELLERHGVDGVIVTPSLARFATSHMGARLVRVSAAAGPS